MLAPRRDVAGDHGQRPDGQGPKRLAGDEDEREQEFVPGVGEGEEGHNQQGQRRQWQGDLAEGTEAGGAVNHRRLLELCLRGTPHFI